MLKKEKVYTEIMSETNASSATISRVNRMLNYGTGCLGEVIDRLNQKEGSEEAKESQFFKCVQRQIYLDATVQDGRIFL